MEFLVEFDVTIPDGTPETEIHDRMNAEANAAAEQTPTFWRGSPEAKTWRRVSTRSARAPRSRPRQLNSPG
jgi:hypothetical protein